MLATLWNTLLVNPLLNILVFFYEYLGGLAIAIIALTLLIRFLMIPLILPSTKSMKKQRELQPELEKIKKKYKYDKKKQAELQMELFKKHGINPASGCLSQIVMLVILFALFNVIRTLTLADNVMDLNNRIYFDFMRLEPNETINTNFLYMDLSQPDPYFVLALLAGAFQFVSSKMMMPFIEKAEKAAEKTEPKTDDIAFMMQQQSMYIMPVMNVIIGATLPAGVVLYIVTTSIFTIAQTYYVSGLGGLKPWFKKLGIIKK